MNRCGETRKARLKTLWATLMAINRVYQLNGFVLVNKTLTRKVGLRGWGYLYALGK